jgi:hypothetical protein
MKIVTEKFYLFLTSIPALALVIFYSFVIRAYMVLGKWPVFNTPDPKNLNFDIHRIIVYLGLMLPFAAFIPWLAVTIFCWNKQLFSKSFLATSILSYVLLFTLFILIIRLDPSGYSNWFAD